MDVLLDLSSWVPGLPNFNFESGEQESLDCNQSNTHNSVVLILHVCLRRPDYQTSKAEDPVWPGQAIFEESFGKSIPFLSQVKIADQFSFWRERGNLSLERANKSTNQAAAGWPEQTWKPTLPAPHPPHPNRFTTAPCQRGLLSSDRGVEVKRPHP